MPTMKRCLGQLSVTVNGRTEHLWPGLEVNVDRELAPGYTLGHAVAGREDLFEDVEPMASADGGPAPAGFVTPLLDPDIDLSAATIHAIEHPAAAAAKE